MQDFKQALENALKQSMERKMNHAQLNDTVNQWDKEEKLRMQMQNTATQTTSQRGVNLISNNVSRATFQFVRDNPNQTKQAICNALGRKGFNASSVATLVGQMVRGGQAVIDAEGRVKVLSTEYTPIKNGTAIIRMQKKKKVKAVSNKVGRPAKEGIAALDVQAAPALPKPTLAPAPVAPAAFDVDALLSTLSFPQAVELFKKLRFMLGEASRGGL